MQDDENFIDYIISDLNDIEFLKFIKNKSLEPFFIASKKMEPLLPLIGEGLDIKSIKRELEYRATYENFHDEKKKNLFEPRFYGVKQVIPELGATILLNHAFLFSERNNIIPLTDNRLFFLLMQKKIERICKEPAFFDFKKELDLKTDTLAMRVLNEYLPKFEFESHNQLLEAKHKLKNQLVAFRESMAAYAAEIEGSPYDKSFTKKIEEIIASKIKPSIQDLDKEIKKSKDTFFTKYLKNIQKGSVPIVGLLFAGLSPSVIIAISAGLITFQTALETYKEVKRLKNNGLSMFLG